MYIIINNEKINIKNCTKFKDRLIGLMFKKNEVKNCLLFPKCNSIHTFFMRQNINVIMTDKNYQIKYIYKNLKPWKIIMPKKNIYYTFELTKNIDNLKINDKLKICS